MNTLATMPKVARASEEVRRQLLDWILKQEIRRQSQMRLAAVVIREAASRKR
jgi:hypothetical protein